MTSTPEPFEASVRVNDRPRRLGADDSCRYQSQFPTPSPQTALSLIVRLVSLLIGLTFVVPGGLAMPLGCLGLAEHVGRLRRLALIARGSLVPRSGPVV
jgi:hypothetical protein